MRTRIMEFAPEYQPEHPAQSQLRKVNFPNWTHENGNQDLLIQCPQRKSLGHRFRWKIAFILVTLIYMVNDYDNIQQNK